MRIRTKTLFSFLICATIFMLVLIPQVGSQIVPQQELEFSESMTLRWNSEVKCSDEGAAYLRSILDLDSNGIVTESEVQQYSDTKTTEPYQGGAEINGIPGEVTNIYLLDYSGAVGDVNGGGDFIYKYEVELSWPTIGSNEIAYNVRFINPEYVSKTETKMNIPENWEIIDYNNFDNGQSPNGKSDFYGELEGGGTSGDITLKKSNGTNTDSNSNFMLILIFITLISVVVIVLLIVITLKKGKDN